MPFMFLILAFLLWAVVWGFFHAIPLYGDALVAKPDHRAVAAYLAIMAGGSAFMVVVATGGLLRNLALFPVSRRKGA
jgi:hypothetical protein